MTQERFCTTRCRAAGHPEVSFAFRRTPPVPELERMLLSYFEDEVGAGTVFAAGQTVQLGWATLQLVDRGDGTLGVHERDMTFERGWVDSVDGALMQTWLQKEVAASLGLLYELSFPHQEQLAVVCKRVRDCSAFVLSRTTPSGRDSGWFVGCADPSHDHDDRENLAPTMLYNVAVLAPSLTAFLALPPGVEVEVGTEPSEGEPSVRVSFSGRPLAPEPGSYLAAREAARVGGFAGELTDEAWSKLGNTPMSTATVLALRDAAELADSEMLAKNAEVLLATIVDASRLAPSDALGDALRDLVSRVAMAVDDHRGWTDDRAEQIANTWLGLFDAMPNVAVPFCQLVLRDPRPAVRIADALLRRSPSPTNVRALGTTLTSGDGWEIDDGDWIEPFVRAHRDALFVHAELGLASSDSEVYGAALALLAPAACSDLRWAPAFEDALAHDHPAAISQLERRVPLDASTATLHGHARFRWLARGASNLEALEELDAFGVDVAHAALRALLERGAPAPSELASRAQRLSSRLIHVGHPQKADAVVDMVLADVPASAKPNLLYNQACARAKLGDGPGAADALGVAIDLDPQQRDDAAKDHDFDAVREHPAFRALFV